MPVLKVKTDNGWEELGGTSPMDGGNADTLDGKHASSFLNLDYITDDEYIVPDGADLNDYTTPGVYRISTASISASLVNGPAYNSSGGRLMVSATSTAHTGVIQMIVFNSTGGQIHYRIRSGDGTWGGWKREVSFLDIYPVGAIYMSVNSTSPASLFGGTWTQLKDRFLLGAGSTYSNGSTGGAATVELTKDEMPSHTHDLWLASTANTGTGTTGYVMCGKYKEGTTDKFYVNDNAVESTGAGDAHENMPPYLVVYMWKRTE